MPDAIMKQNLPKMTRPAWATLWGMIRAQAGQTPTALAIAAPDRVPLDYSALSDLVGRQAAALRAMGITRHDRVALLLPNGPELATAFLTVASGAICCPLDPQSPTETVTRYLENLRATALVALAGSSTPATRAARRLGIRIIEADFDSSGPAGLFALKSGGEHATSAPSDIARPGDLALILHTSGTTGEPKQVPLTHANLCASARDIATALHLTAADRCLNVLSLFHIHGLVAGVLSSLASGGSVACAPGFECERFFDWLEMLRPTWYTAVPTVHRAIADRAHGHLDIIRRNPLRFIRSSSAPLPAPLAEELEHCFNAPVIEAYGMTEAAHQIACNPLPPARRKPGSVGVATTTEVAVMDDANRPLPTGATGEIVVRGPNVFGGYANDRDANTSVFAAGWFRTGDQGRIDADGYLHITGRIREIINRGGRKVSPRDVDDALLEHPAVAQAASFCVPHATLGEDIAAAIVLKDGASASASDIRASLFGRLADFKIPTQIVIVDSIPVSGTGKIERTRLASALADTLATAFVPPRDDIEQAIAEIFKEVLAAGTVGAEDNFFALGGDSLRGFQVLARVRTRLQADVPIVELFKAPTVAQLARAVTRARSEATAIALDQQLKSQPATGHVLVARTLASLGVTHVYGVPGQPAYETFGACAAEGLRPISTHHQHPAALMAVAHNFFAGQQRAVSIVSTGVPTANALGAALVAHDNCWPLIILATAVPSAAGNMGYFMTLDATRLFQPIAKWSTRVLETHAIPSAIGKAFDVAIEGRPGPVLVELPEDVLNGLAAGSDPPHRADRPPVGLQPDPTQLERAVAALVGAKRPLLIVGKGARWGSPFPELRELVDALCLPFITSPIARGAPPDDHPLCMNAVRWAAQSQADLVLLLGARLDWNLRYGEHIARDASVIQVDIHAPEFECNPRANCGVHADVGEFLRTLLARIGEVRFVEAGKRRDASWVQALQAARQDIRARHEAHAAAEHPAISPYRLAREIRDALPSDAITIFDSNLVMAACERMIPSGLPASRLTPGTSGCMGVGVPYAIAAKLAHPQRPVVAICGDFAFGLGAMEIETAVRYNVPVVIVIANNDGNGGSLRQRMHMRNSGAERVMMFQPGLRYEGIAEVLGGAALHVEHAGDIGPALARALGCNRPACINVAVDPDAPYPAD